MLLRLWVLGYAVFASGGLVLRCVLGVFVTGCGRCCICCLNFNCWLVVGV